MNFFKWSLYILAVSAFIWVVFFRPIDSTTEAEVLVGNDAETIVEEEGESLLESTIEDTEAEVINEIESENVTEVFDTEVVDEVTPTSHEDINIQSKYLVVVGSFGVKANANKMLKRVETFGMEGTISLIRGLHRVIIASTNNEQEAEQIRDQFTNTHHEPVFVLEQ
jgi:hypothetical protein